MYHRVGRLDHAIATFESALAICRQLAFRDLETEVLTHLGDAYLADGKHDSARVVWRQALSILQQLGHTDAEGILIRLQMHPTSGPKEE